MALNVETIARTVSIVKPYEVAQRNGKNGTFESRSVMFKIATDRDYRKAVTKEDGSVTQENPTDFFTCRATGPVADTFAKYASAKKYDANGNEKLVSRRVQIHGHEETYKATRRETISFMDGNQQKQVTVELPEERKIIVVEKIRFLDKNPVNAQSQDAAVATATVVNTATPVPAVQQSVAQQAPQVAQTMPTVEVQPSIPVVNEVSSEEAPF